MSPPPVELSEPGVCPTSPMARGKSGFCNGGLVVGGEVRCIPTILGELPSFSVGTGTRLDIVIKRWSARESQLHYDHTLPLITISFYISFRYGKYVARNNNIAAFYVQTYSIPPE